MGEWLELRTPPLVEDRFCSVTAPKMATNRSPGVRREQWVEGLMYRPTSKMEGPIRSI